MGCAGLQQLEGLRDAKRHMLAAAKMENSQQLDEAVREYVYVARNFPATGFYKTAVFKAAMLSGHQDNPRRNLSTSLYWFKEYLKLPLSTQEQERVQFLVALIEQNKQYQDSRAQLQTDVQNQQTLVSQKDVEIAGLEAQGKKQNKQLRQLQKKIASYEKQIEEQDKQIRQLEAEISKTQEALQRLKEIDMRIHQRRLK